MARDREEDDLPAWLIRRLDQILLLSEQEERQALGALIAEHPSHEGAIRAWMDRMLEEGGALLERAGSPSPEEGEPTRIGPFRILSKLGQGGMGTVYLAEQKEPVRRRVALKVIKLGMDTEQVLLRFEAERQALAMMEHGSIARIYDCGATERGQPWFAMEYVKGRPITRYADDHKLGIAERLELLLQVCSGVQHAHTKGVIHRDLTPKNVLVTVQDGRPRVKIIDFGLARATDHRLVEATIFTEQGQIVGTPEYMSPEQAGLEDLDIDTRTDVYTLGVLLYELLCGELPFAKETLRKAGLLEIQRIIREEEPPKPSTRITTAGKLGTEFAQRRRTDLRSLTRRLRGDLDWIVMQALEKDRTRRYETAAQLAEDLRRHLEHEPVLASPPSVGYRLGKMIKKHKGPVAAGLAVFVALVGGLSAAIWQAGIARAEKRRAEEQAGIARAERKHAQEQEGIAKDQRQKAQQSEARALRHLDHFDRLSVVVQLEDAQSEMQELQPAWPEKIGALERWLQARGERLKTELPRVRETLAELREKARPRTAEEQRQDREGHPKYAEYRALKEKKLPALERAMALRQGKVKHAAMPVPADAPKDASGLNERAWPLVDPERKAGACGQEALGLVLAERAVGMASDEKRHMILDTLAWALFANGRDEEAKAASMSALDAAPASEKKEYEGYRSKLGKAIDEAEETLAKARQELSKLEPLLGERRTWTFAEESDRFLHETLLRVERDLLAFLGEKGSLAEVGRRLAWARRIDELTREHPKARVSWEEARAAIKKADGIVASELYKEVPIDLEPQTGLVPIGMNPKTLLWEFYHLRSAFDPAKGTDPAKLPIPRHRKDGRIRMTGRHGIVFVLIPGGTFLMGAQKSDEEKPNYDPWAESDETPHEVALEAYFLARHELTQGQWQRLSGGENPSRKLPGSSWRGDPGPITWMHPVTQVDWFMSRDVTREHRLSLPTEAQWEYGCRAGAGTPWFPGDEVKDLQGYGNIADRHAKSTYPAWACSTEVDDSWASEAPVGTYLPNAFGLHDTHGNVWEWCQDRYGSYSLPVDGTAGERQVPPGPSSDRVYRGGSFLNTARPARSAYRDPDAPSIRDDALGLRPARALEQ